MKNKTLITVIAIAAVALAGYFLIGSTDRGYAKIPEEVLAKETHLYQDPNCGCCGLYAAHLRREGFDVTVHNEDHMDKIKEEYGIPENMESCHTTIIGDRVIEGHMPMEGIGNMFRHSEVKNIALPGMPKGSPGMSGMRSGSFTVYSFGPHMEPRVFTEL